MKELKVIGTGVLNTSEIERLKEFPKEYGIQRMVNKRNVEQIKKSMEQLYIPIVVKVNQDWFILDGQHSKQALQEMSLKNVQIVYVMYDTKGKDREVCVLLNTTGKKWEVDDFMELWISCENKNYIWFKDFKDTFNLSYQSTMYLIYGSQEGSNSSNTNKFKNGEMVIDEKQKNQAIKIARYLQEIKMYVDRKISNQRNFQNAFIKMAYNKDYNHDIMISKLEYQRDKLFRSTNMNGYVTMLESIYNYRNKFKVNFQ